MSFKITDPSLAIDDPAILEDEGVSVVASVAFAVMNFGSVMLVNLTVCVSLPRLRQLVH